MKILFFDTETTGLPLWSEPSDHPNQPHLVQFSAIFMDRDGINGPEVINMIVAPDGWTIPDEVVAVHGITTERATIEGSPENMAVDAFVELASKAELISGFGVDFDLRIMRIAMLRSGREKEACDEFASKIRKHCCMRQATPLCKIPPTYRMMASGRKTFKSPTLTEAVKELLGEDLPGAHDAMVDVEATSRLYFHMNKPAPPMFTMSEVLRTDDEAAP